MMPMPPTTSEIEATAASSSAMMRLRALGGLGDLAQVAHGEVVVVAGLDAVAAREDLGDLADRRLHVRPG